MGVHEIPDRVLLDLSAERVVQRGRWGDGYDDSHTTDEWATIIGMYLGRVTTSIVHSRPMPNEEATLRYTPEAAEELRTALIKLATTTISWIETIDRREQSGAS